jgi:hypothetical protein
MKLYEVLERVPTDQRNVSGQYQKVTRKASQCFTSAQHRVSGTELLFLIDEFRVGQQGFNPLRLMPHDDENPRRNRLSGTKDVLDESAAPNLMQYFRFARFHTGTLTRSQNQDLQILHHTPSIA